MSAKSTKLEKERRIFTVQGWIIDGAQDDFILRQIKTQWGGTTRNARRYLKWAYDRWKPQSDLEIADKRNAAIARLQNISRNLDPKYRGTPSGITAVLSVEKELNKLKDIKPVKRIDLTSKGGAIIWKEEKTYEADDKADPGT